jgi:3-isopropylmalate/(R)-2-methylmalate dehydratase small subunit
MEPYTRLTDVLALRRQMHERPGAQITADLDEQSVRGPDGRVYRFEIDAARKLRLAKGLDDAALAMQYRGDIEGFEQRHQAEWLWVAAQSARVIRSAT